MLDPTNQESNASENGNSKYVDATDGRGVGTSRRLAIDEPSLEERRRDLDDLAVWMSGLEATDLPLDDPHSLCNGRAFAELLHEIDKSFFDERWLETMPEMRTTSHLAVKRSNIRKLWRKMSDYILNVMNRRICGARWEEIGDRVDGLDETDIPVAADLAMAVTFIALVGPNQEKYVHYSKIQTAKFAKEMTSVARLVGTVIEEMPDAIEPTFLQISELHDPQSDMRFSLPESSSINGNGLPERRITSSNSVQVLVEAQLEIDALRAEKDSLQKEVDRLTKALESPPLDTPISSDTTNINRLEKQNEELRVKRLEAEERVLELEAALEQFQSAVEELTLENDALTNTQKEFNLLKTHLDTAQSDVEEWRVKANQYQSDAELVKKREKEVKKLQGQVKSLTSRLEHHVKTATIDEDNKAGMIQLKIQIERLTANNAELIVALESKKRIVEQLEIQLVRHKEKVKELEDRKDDLIAERNELENKLLFSCHRPFSEKSELPLEIENKRLAERIQELEELEPLQGEIITIKSQNGVLEKENLAATKQKEELERQVAELNDKLAKNQQQLEKANVEIEKMRESKTKAETKLTDMKKLLELRTNERDNNEVLLAKSKRIIDELEEQVHPIGEDETTSVYVYNLQQKMEKLETELNSITQELEQENRLITSAAHQQVLDRSSDNVMNMRAHAGSDEPQTLLDSQKMPGALQWSFVGLGFFLLFAYILIAIYSSINPPGQVKSLTLEHYFKTATIDNKAGMIQLRTQIGTLTADNVELNVALESKKRIVEQLEIQLIQHKEKVKDLEDRKDELENRLLYKIYHRNNNFRLEWDYTVFGKYDEILQTTCPENVGFQEHLEKDIDRMLKDKDDYFR
ncbi:hypothetical protein CAEBREN_12298 [Caenorhabditis brenneri]|uniref:Calponin-homology (CH) domain-containing protein n=1 Tax=Caenorhabditis brenneri TaxID=135651 RepID=G0MUW4_CAEBE|nr:hypothetical protein CAEBREN_12298 [Caenorhabditis brenneri]